MQDIARTGGRELRAVAGSDPGQVRLKFWDLLFIQKCSVTLQYATNRDSLALAKRGGVVFPGVGEELGATPHMLYETCFLSEISGVWCLYQWKGDHTPAFFVVTGKVQMGR
jgi:hypothetical protein